MGEAKRYRRVKAKPGELVAQYGRDEDGNLGVCYGWGAAGASSADGRVLSDALERLEVFDGCHLIETLRRRNYDISTLRFSIKRKPEPPSPADKEE